MFETISKAIDYINPWKTVPAFMDAYEKAKETKDKGWFDKLGIFFEEFSNAMNEVKKEKEEASEETLGDIEKTLETPKDELLTDVKKKMGISSNVKEEDLNTFEDVAKTGISTFSGLENKNRAHTYTALEKLNNATNDKPAMKLTVTEIKSLAAFGISSLSDIKEKCGGDKGKCKKILESIMNSVDGSNYELKKLFGGNVKGIFKGSALSLGLSLKDSFDIGITDALTINTVLNNFQGDLKDEDEVAKFFQEKIFKNTDDANMKKALRAMHKLYKQFKTGSGAIDLDSLSELIVSIDQADYKNLTKVLYG